MILNSVLREKNGEERLVTFCPFPVYSHTGHRPAFAATSLNLARSQVFPSIKAGGQCKILFRVSSRSAILVFSLILFWKRMHARYFLHC